MHTSQNPILSQPILKFKPDAITAPTVFRDEKTTKNRRLFTAGTISPKEFVGTISPGFHLFGITKGQFSLIDAIGELLEQTGPADVSISTWTAANADLSKLSEILTGHGIKSIRFLCDYTFQQRQPQIIAQLRQTFGNQAIALTKIHAKFTLIKAAKWRITVRTSMNLNTNPRIEDIEVKDDPDLFQFLDDIFTNIFGTYDREAQKDKTSSATFWQEFKKLEI